MSNFKHNRNLQEQDLYSETESDTNNGDKTVAFLAALEETRTILNILLQAVLCRDNTGSYDESTLHTNASLESVNEYKENQSRFQNCIEQTTNPDDITNTDGNSNKLLVPTDISSNESILVENSYLGDPLMIPLPWSDQSLLELNYLSANNKPNQQVPVEPDFNNIYNENNTISSLKRIKTLQEEEVLQIPLEVTSSNNCKSLYPNTLKEEIPYLPTAYDDERTLEYISASKEMELSEVEEMRKLLELSQKSYISCEDKINTILNQIENNKDSTVDMSYDALCSASLPDTTRRILESRTLNLERKVAPRGESPENKKTTVLQLPQNLIPNSPSNCEKEFVGDDVAKTETHILCECEQPGVDGGAVPVVTSFTVSQDDTNLTKNKSQNEMSETFLNTNEAKASSQKHKPSLIPKLTNSFKTSDGSSLLARTEKQRYLVPSSNCEDKEEENKHITINISSKMASLQERLKATTSLIREKIENNEEKPVNEKTKSDLNEKPHLRFDEESFERQKRQKMLRYEFSKNITRIAQDAINLTEINDISSQTAVVDNLYRYITELKRLSNEIKDIHSSEDENICVTDSQNTNDSQCQNCEPANKTKTKDNTIYIKFLPTKLGTKKKKGPNSEVQSEYKKGLASNDIQSDSETEKKSMGESSLKDVDSMDGMFIPSSEEPPQMEEDEDEDGLDITITFPEFQQHSVHEDSSHLSVCFSDLSAEALGRLKRCPKEFTLRMDFVHGKMFFQSGKSPANNFSIRPDLKITECVINEKMSDIISIKPSTECMYTSQIIPVEGSKPKSSIKTLKSTDSELFTVVSLPKINRKTSGNTKSCITLKNEQYISTGSLLSGRRSYKSMPQIPSLTRILEEPTVESVSTSRAAMMNSDKKPKNRALQKKRTNTSVDKLSEA